MGLVVVDLLIGRFFGSAHWAVGSSLGLLIGQIFRSKHWAVL